MTAIAIDPQRIYQARLAAGLTQADVAYRVRSRGHKATERSIRRWEGGQNAPHANVIPALAAALDITVDELYQPTEEGDDAQTGAPFRDAA